MTSTTSVYDHFLQVLVVDGEEEEEMEEEKKLKEEEMEEEKMEEEKESEEEEMEEEKMEEEYRSRRSEDATHHQPTWRAEEAPTSVRGQRSPGAKCKRKWKK
ncbi:hypothetical protein Pcinc_007801 [Petrolisthes cinctipes]|uniref:Uncharacterized protein n=1 Tax=Petrolisthes cinctipes TaxID=88211 RepID=A0AAE1G7T9_PETCI|nr:hypothetical protein Pcinc_007801 [Petrolisthes cinctipes]